MNFKLASKAFIIKNGKLLILKRRPDDVHMPNIYELPGGRLELGENPFEGIQREVKEETNLDIEVLNPIEIRHFERQDKQTVTMIIFLCKATSEELIISEEHSDYKWVELEKAKEITDHFFYSTIDAYEKVFK